MPASAVGLDIGAYSIKIVAFRDTKPNPTLEVLAAIRTPPGSVRDGEILDRFDVGQTIREVAVAAGVRARTPVYAAVGGSSLSVRGCAFASLQPAQLRAVAGDAARAWLPPAGPEVVVEVQALPGLPTTGGTDAAVFVASRSAVLSRLQTIRLAGLRCVGVDAEPVAVLRALVYGTRDTFLLARTVAVVALGEDCGWVVVVRRGTVAYIRPVSTAGAALTRAVSQVVYGGTQAAERKKEFSAVGVSQEVFANASREEQETSLALARQVDALATELREVLDDYRRGVGASDSAGAIDQVLLTGGTSLLEGLDGALSEALGIRVSRAGVFDMLSIETAGFDPDYVRLCGPSAATAAGLALTPLMENRQYAFAADPSMFGMATEVDLRGRAAAR
jgi:type IV pilus assembly protein PilM